LTGNRAEAIDNYVIVSNSIEPYFGGIFYNLSREKLEELQ
jgi:hypothetical protein